MKNEEELEKLRMENELKKMKLMLEHGAMFSDNPDKMPIDPFIENQFLNNIEALERSYNRAERILVFDFINRPDFRKADNIPDYQIHTELDRLMNIMNENGIQLDTLCEVEEREIYRFVTEELFLHEVENMRIPGMMNCFIYEEFHPNHEYDIRNYCFEGVEAFLNKKEQYVTMHFTKEATESKWFRNFRGAFSSFTIKHFEIKDILITGINASANFTIDFTGIIEGSNQNQNFDGTGSAEFLFQYDYWYIQMLNLPPASSSL
jgi:hypothetical protein